MLLQNRALILLYSEKLMENGFPTVRQNSFSQAMDTARIYLLMNVLTDFRKEYVSMGIFPMR